MIYSLPTVTVAAATRRLATEAALRVELGSPAEPLAARVDDVLDQASAAVESFCGRSLARETISEVFRLDPWSSVPSLKLSRRPIVSITSVTEDGTAVASEDREFDGDAGMVYRLSSDERVSFTARKITVVYVAGFLMPDESGTTLPYPITRAALITAAAMFHAIGRDPALRSESVDGVAAASYLDPRAAALGLPPAAADLLMPYRDVRI